MVFFKKSVSPSLLAEHEQILSLFKGCDVNKDGKLSKDEVKEGFRRLQSRFPRFRAQRAFKVADKNGDGFISEAELDELVDYVLDCYEGSGKREKKMVFFFNKRTETTHKDLPPKEDYDELVKLFKRCDVNNDGRLSWEEVKAGFRRLHSRFPLYRTHRAFQMADQNHDGYINVGDELDKLVTYVLECYPGTIKLRLI
ncbi:probable calcium-binding protein CML33 [Gossypium hirsutum]|nr:probable calcium-binding protein CML33 [Gossypium hirsutum]